LLKLTLLAMCCIARRWIAWPWRSILWPGDELRGIKDALYGLQIDCVALGMSYKYRRWIA
jgi:hypothetical protein